VITGILADIDIMRNDYTFNRVDEGVHKIELP